MKCYICGNTLTDENRSSEHIIINAAGGRLKSKDLICETCNSTYGSKIDSELAKQLNHFANMLMIKRERGEPQPIEGVKESTGEKYFIDVGGKPRLSKPVVEIEKLDKGAKIRARVRTEKEMKKKLTEIAKKIPKLNVKEAMKTAKYEKEDVGSLKVEFSMGGTVALRAVCKCAANFYIFNGGDCNNIQHLIPYIKGENELNVVAQYYEEGTYEIKPDESFHVLHLVGDSHEKILYCFVDYFNIYRYIVCLNDDYNGEDIKKTYCYDLINRKVVNLLVNIKLNRDDYVNFLEKGVNSENKEKIKVLFNRFLRLAYTRQYESSREEKIDAAIQKVFGKYPDGTVITEEMLGELTNEIMRIIEPDILRASEMKRQEFFKKLEGK